MAINEGSGERPSNPIAKPNPFLFVGKLLGIAALGSFLMLKNKLQEALKGKKKGK